MHTFIHSFTRILPRFTFKDFVDRFRFLVSGIGPAHKVGIFSEQ